MSIWCLQRYTEKNIKPGGCPGFCSSDLVDCKDKEKKLTFRLKRLMSAIIGSQDKEHQPWGLTQLLLKVTVTESCKFDSTSVCSCVHIPRN